MASICSETPLKYLEYDKYTHHNRNMIKDMEIKEVPPFYTQLRVIMKRIDDDDEFEDCIQGIVDITERKVFLREFTRAEIVISLYDEYINDITCIPYMYMDVYMEKGNVYIKKRIDKLEEIHLFPSLSVLEYEIN
jgi:O-phosphoseryl-tRNA(Cys) synthetase